VRKVGHPSHPHAVTISISRSVLILCAVVRIYIYISTTGTLANRCSQRFRRGHDAPPQTDLNGCYVCEKPAGCGRTFTSLVSLNSAKSLMTITHYHIATLPHCHNVTFGYH
jgi:hypothetical protein